MNLKFSTLLVGLSTLLLTQTKPLVGQQIPASELPPAGTDTGLEGKYDPTNGIAQLIQDKSAESAASKIFEDDRVLVFMPLPEEEVVAPGHVLFADLPPQGVAVFVLHRQDRHVGDLPVEESTEEVASSRISTRQRRRNALAIITS